MSHLKLKQSKTAPTITGISGSAAPTMQQRRTDSRANKAVERMRNECRKKGISGVRGLAVLFRGMDADYSRTLTLHEVREGLARYGINVSSEDVRLIFARMDNDDNGSVDFKVSQGIGVRGEYVRFV